MTNPVMTREAAIREYDALLNDAEREGGAAMVREVRRELCKNDLFYLLVVECKRVDLNDDFHFQRCKEVEAQPDENLDLWARDHGKSSIITFGKTIQDILADPELTFGIFSHTRPAAKDFLGWIKSELEGNEDLKALFPDVLFANPQKEAPKWNEDEITVKRQGNPKECTVEAYGLVDGQPIGKHFRRCVYDDIIVPASVTTPEMIHKTTQAWELSLNLGTSDCRRRYVGTRYAFGDTWAAIMERQAATPRTIPATDDGTAAGNPVLLSRDLLEEKRNAMGPYVFSCQMLMNPVAEGVQTFNANWLQYYEPTGPNQRAGWNLYVLVDPAHSKKKGSDYTVIWVVGLGVDGNYYILDGVRDRLNLTERCARVFDMVRKYNPIRVGYERYGLQADIEHIRQEQNAQNYRFPLVELGGSMSKVDRIRRLVPVFEQGKVFIPYHLAFVDHTGKSRNLTAEFVNEEFSAFPVASHDDMLDALARILDPDLQTKFPRQEDPYEGLHDDVIGDGVIDWNPFEVKQNAVWRR